MATDYRPDHRIRELLQRFEIDREAAVPALGDLRREIHQYGKRRCDVEASRDNLIYYLGFAFEVNGALNIDSLALAGLLSLPWTDFATALKDEMQKPVDVVDGLRLALLRPGLLDWARAQGAWLQWKRLEAIYRHEVDDFRNSIAFHRPNWRRKGITRAQHYLIGEIHRIVGVPVSPLATRGEAYEFIAAHGGNPRFLKEPEAPVQWWRS